MITPEDFPGVDEDAARRIIVAARSIAPCIDSFEADSDARKDALAILRGVAADVSERAPRGLVSDRVGPMQQVYRDVSSYFSADDRASLQSLCGTAKALGLPRGSFPDPGFVTRLWPEKNS